MYKRTKIEAEVHLFLTSGYVSAWKHVAGIKLCARTAEALEDLLIQIAQACRIYQSDHSIDKKMECCGSRK